MSDAIALLRELRPEPDAPDALLLERILATPPRRARPRAVRRLVLATLALPALAVAFSPSPSVVASAAEALNDPDTILHFRAEVRHRVDGDELRAIEPDARVDAEVEVYQTAGGRQKRVLIGGNELVEDRDAKTSMAYSVRSNEVIRHTDPGIVDPAHRVPDRIDAPTPVIGALTLGDELAGAFERARRGEGEVRLVGPATVRGIDVHELELTFEADSRTVRRTVYVDRETFLPVRVIERAGRWTDAITDYVLAERLPRNGANERLLRMAPHPGAKLVVQGPR